MLRLRYMPSDFHPLVLVLGDRADLRVFAAQLGAFAASAAETPITGAAPSPTTLRLVPATEALGLWRDDGETERFAWRLSPDLAAAFHDELRDLAADDQASGSVTLESGTIGETPVKVSHGEFTDDFLAPGSTIPA